MQHLTGLHLIFLLIILLTFELTGISSYSKLTRNPLYYIYKFILHHRLHNNVYMDTYCMLLQNVTKLWPFFTYNIDVGEKLSLAMALLNLVLRPITILVLGRIYADRMGNGFSTRFGNLFNGKLVWYIKYCPFSYYTIGMYIYLQS